jgi:hypothetical protein
MCHGDIENRTLEVVGSIPIGSTKISNKIKEIEHRRESGLTRSRFMCRLCASGILYGLFCSSCPSNTPSMMVLTMASTIWRLASKGLLVR